VTGVQTCVFRSEKDRVNEQYRKLVEQIRKECEDGQKKLKDAYELNKAQCKLAPKEKSALPQRCWPVPHKLDT
jgi:benzoyl-CoA reductase/2-hydroxyglutaryl-CoA dehydratase subunit BcrC/BadD/HgdB